MKRKPAILAGIGGIAGIVGGILIIIGAFMGDNFSKVLWIAAALFEFFNAILIFRIVAANRKK